ncbi:MAG: DUF4339 domain-containing protein [Muribaculaceae bacterium]|nr:DUF4339 domain-containing protein [Muribaculaceae bacterium]
MNEKKYWIKKEGQDHGPLALAELSSYNLGPESIIWVTGTENWVRAKELPEVMRVISDNTIFAGYDDETQIGVDDGRTQLLMPGNEAIASSVGASAKLRANANAREREENNPTRHPGGKVVITISSDSIISSLTNPLAAPAAGVLLTVVSLIMTIVNISYASAGEFILLLMMFFVAPGAMAGVAMYDALNLKKYTDMGDAKKALSRSGLSLGLSIGAIVCAIIGIIVAGCEFELL